MSEYGGTSLGYAQACRTSRHRGAERGLSISEVTLWDEIVSELPARLFIPEPLGRPRLVVRDARIGHAGENRRGQEGSMIVFMTISLIRVEPHGWLLSTVLIGQK